MIIPTRRCMLWMGVLSLTSTAVTVAEAVSVTHSNKTCHGCDDCYLKRTTESVSLQTLSWKSVGSQDSEAPKTQGTLLKLYSFSSIVQPWQQTITTTKDENIYRSKSICHKIWFQQANFKLADVVFLSFRASVNTTSTWKPIEFKENERK